MSFVYMHPLIWVICLRNHREKQSSLLFNSKWLLQYTPINISLFVRIGIWFLALTYIFNYNTYIHCNYRPIIICIWNHQRRIWLRVFIASDCKVTGLAPVYNYWIALRSENETLVEKWASWWLIFTNKENKFSTVKSISACT